VFCPSPNLGKNNALCPLATNAKLGIPKKNVVLITLSSFYVKSLLPLAYRAKKRENESMREMLL